MPGGVLTSAQGTALDFMLKKLATILLGKEKDPLSKETRKHIALISIMAWIGLGADGLSSSCYGPEEAFVALGAHPTLSIFLAMSMVVTVFVISLAYVQIIELFPNGGGGYRVAGNLLGPKAGLVSGSALIIDYILTISISVASGVDALFSMLPLHWMPYKIYAAFFLVAVLVLLNMRGMKESIKVLAPIFIGFLVTHLFIIVYGVAMHSNGISNIVPSAVNEANSMGNSVGWLFTISLLMRALSLGGGTYTGLEAVSNNVHTLAEPRVRTGKWTMFYVAFSLAVTAAGITVLYLLWHVQRETGKTLNATTFHAITQSWVINGISVGDYFVPILLVLEAGLLFVAANTGFLAGPAVMSNMASDSWLPKLFSSLSSRLVTQNGVVLMGITATLALIITGGRVDVLVVLYSINVFVTFSLSMLGLCKHHINKHGFMGLLKLRGIISVVGLIVCSGILVVTLYEKFTHGAWMTIFITSSLIIACYYLHRHYRYVELKLQKFEDKYSFADGESSSITPPMHLDPTKPTAAIIVTESYSAGMYCLEEIEKLFHGAFHNFIFIGVGEISSDHFSEEDKMRQLRRDVKKTLKNYVSYCKLHDKPATYFLSYGTDVVDELTKSAGKVLKEYPNTVFFGIRLLFDSNFPFMRLLHNQNAYILQRRMHLLGKNMIILPMKV